jgi:hypothetical protein
MHRPLAFILLVALSLALASPALAHPVAGASPAAALTPGALVVAPVLDETIAAAPSGPSTPWTVIGLLGGLALAVGIGRRRALVLALAVVILFLAFETGLHSTHHLGNPDDASHCVVASTSAQLSADVAPDHIQSLVAPAPTAPAPALVTPATGTRAVAPDAGRGPPSLPV